MNTMQLLKLHIYIVTSLEIKNEQFFKEDVYNLLTIRKNNATMAKWSFEQYKRVPLT